MPKKTWIYTNGSWKEVKNIWIYQNGNWKSNVIPFIYDGSWKPTILYDLSDPEWVSSNLSVTSTSVQFSYKNNNSVSVNLSIEVSDSNGQQAMGNFQETLAPGQTRIFNSNDYNDSFSPSQTYTFDAFFTATHYNESSTSNQVTTSAPPKTATPTTQSISRTTNSVEFKIINNDDPGVVSWQIRQGSTTGTIVQNDSDLISQSISPTLTGASPNTTYWLVNARVQSNNKSISDPGVNRSLTTFNTTTTTAPPLTFNNSNFGSINTDGGTSSIRTAVGSGTVYVSLSGSGSGALQRRRNYGTWISTTNGTTFGISNGQTLQFRIINVSTEMTGSVALRRTNSSGVTIGTLSFNIPAPTTTTTTTEPPSESTSTI